MDCAVTTPLAVDMEQVLSLLNNERVLIISGVRHSGKSYIGKRLKDELQKQNSNDVNVILVNVEKTLHEVSSADELIARLKEQYAFDKKNYVLLDEIIHVRDWESAVNFLYRLDNCKLILFSSHKCVFLQNSMRYGKIIMTCSIYFPFR